MNQEQVAAEIARIQNGSMSVIHRVRLKIVDGRVSEVETSLWSGTILSAIIVFGVGVIAQDSPAINVEVPGVIKVKQFGMYRLEKPAFVPAGQKIDPIVSNAIFGVELDEESADAAKALLQ